MTLEAHLPVRHHLDAAGTFGRAQFPGPFIPHPRFLGVGLDAANEALRQNVWIVCGPHGKCCRGIAGVGGPAEEQARSRDVAGQRSRGVGHLLKKNKIAVFDGHGRLAGSGKLKVEKDGKPVADLTAKNIILATGARARSLPGL